MSLPVQAAGSTGPSSLVQKVNSPTPGKAGKSGAAKPVASFGSTPAAALTISAQAKALAIKTGHDPDGVQDGK